MADNKSPDFKSLFNQAREIDRKEKLEKEKKQREEMQKQLEEEEKQREEYAEKLQQDKINLLKAKQNNEDNSLNEKTEKKNYTIKQKISNFFYHNKWWLGIGCFFSFVLCYVIYDVATAVKPDMTIMLLANDEKLYQRTVQIQNYFGQYVGDRNEDGEVRINILYMPISDYLYNNQAEVYMASNTQLNAMLQTDESLIVIADEESSAILWNDELLLGLEKYYPDNEKVKETGFYISDTDFASKIEYDTTDSDIEDDVYIGIRKVEKGASYENSMREKFNEDFKILKQIIEDLS